MRFSIRNKIIAYVAVPVTAIFLAAMVWSSLFVRDRAQANIRADLAKEAERFAADFEGFISKAAEVAETTAGFIETAPDLTEAQIYALLRENVRRNNRIYGAGMAFEPGTFHKDDRLFCPYAYRDGSGIESMNIDRSVLDWYADPQWQWWGRAKEAGAGLWTDPYFDDGAGNILMVTYSEPFFLDGRFRGVTTVDISLSDLRETIGDRMGGGREFAILTASGQFVYSQDPTDILVRSAQEKIRRADREDLIPIIERVLQSKSGTEQTQGLFGHGTHLIAHADIPSTGWTLITYTSESEAYAVFRENIAWAILPFLATLLLIVASILLVARNLAKPITLLRDNALQVAAGDLSAGPIQVSSRDEIGELAQAFTTMQGKVANREERLRNAREVTLHQLLESAPDGMMVVDTKGRIRRCNTAAENIFGYTSGGDVLRSGQKALAELVSGQPEGDSERLVGWISDPTTIPIPAALHLNGLRTDGTRFPIDATLSSFEEPEEIRVVIAMRDVTERKQAQEALTRALKEAEVANQAKSQFLASMSHELRTPLNGVLGYSQILQRDPKATPRQKEQLNAIINCGDHLLNLINDVLDLSKIEAGQIDVVNTPCDLHLLLKRVGDVSRHRAQAKGVAFSIDISPEVPRGILTDEGKLRQILVNLLGNAVKFTEIGQVTLEIAEKPTQSLRFDIRDTGVGIPPNELEDVFDPFKQLEAGKAAGGTGLGLAISRQLAEALEGSLTVTSRVGEGSVFTVTIPLEEVSAEELGVQQTLDHSEHPTVRVAPGKTVTVVVADDRKTNRDILTTLLTTSGFTVVEADDGDVAVTEIRKLQPDLVLLDIRMPRLNGILALNQVRADPAVAKTKVIAVTASVFPEFRDKALEAGFDDFLSKPFRTPSLFALLEKHLEASLLVREEPAKSDPPEASDQETVQPGTETNLSEETITELKSAVRIRNLTAIKKIAHRIGEDPANRETADRITAFTRKFDFISLQKLITDLGSENPET